MNFSPKFLIVFEKPFQKVRQGQATPTESEWVTPHTPSIEVLILSLHHF